MKMMTLWLKVTSDIYEHPIMICDSIKELSEKTGAKVNSIYSEISHNKKNPNRYKCRYRRVDVEED